MNEAAVSFMGFKDPVGAILEVDGTRLTIIGVIKNMIVESPYAVVRPSMWYLNRQHGSIVNIKVNPAISMQEALARIEPVFARYDPEQLFDYKFADEEYAKKFGQEQRIGKLASFFAILAIFISCLGLFGMASFMAERRTKEIGVRKVLGASVMSLWRLLSKEFIVLVVVSLLIAAPLAYFMMRNWLQNYEYRTTISWWIYAVTGLGILTITLLTVSYQSIRAALVNPVKSLKTE
jgi:ABC-type antimicrobial peptide transport system permease subunit